MSITVTIICVCIFAILFSSKITHFKYIFNEHFSCFVGCISQFWGLQIVQGALSRVVRTAEKAIRTSLPWIINIYTQWSRTRAKIIIKDIHHPGHRLLSFQPSGERDQILRRSFYPQATRLLNKDTWRVCRTFMSHINTYITHRHRHYHILFVLIIYTSIIYIYYVFLTFCCCIVGWETKIISLHYITCICMWQIKNPEPSWIFFFLFFFFLQKAPCSAFWEAFSDKDTWDNALSRMLYYESQHNNEQHSHEENACDANV